jgi:hypothetical protein
MYQEYRFTEEIEDLCTGIGMEVPRPLSFEGEWWLGFHQVKHATLFKLAWDG